MDAAHPGGESADQQVVILTGLSGGGKTAAAKLLEDLGYRVVDNLPAELLAGLAELVARDPVAHRRVAIVVDVRTGDAEVAYRAMRGALEGRGIRPRVIFLEARDDALIRRFSETRHRHPLADGRSISASIREERRRLAPLRADSDVIIDTSSLSLRELREQLYRCVSEVDPDAMTIQVLSFAYKAGIPLEADLVFDARFLRNPYYVEELRPLSGLVPAVREYVLGQPAAGDFLRILREFLAFALPAYREEGKTRLTIAIGCTGGFHRSIVLAEELATWLRTGVAGSVEVVHRELEAGTGR